MTTKPNTSSLKRKMAKMPKVPVEVLANLSQFNIDLMKDEFEVVMNNQIQELAELLHRKDQSKIGTIYEVSSQIISSSSFVKAEWIAKAAQSLCEVHEIMSGTGNWDWDAAQVHGKTMQLLASLEGDHDAVRQSLLDGLSSVVAAKRH